MARFKEGSVIPDCYTKADLTTYVEGLKPRADLIVADQLLIVGDTIGLAAHVPFWRKFNKVFGDFSTAGTTSADVTLVSIGAGGVVEAIKVITKTAFVGGSVSACNLSVGFSSSDPDDYINDQSVFTVTTATGGEYSTVDFLAENASTAIICQLKTVSANIDQLTAGSVDVWIKYAIADSAL